MSHKITESNSEEERDLSHSSTAELLKKNLQWSELLYEQNKRIQRRLTMIVVAGYIKWALILTPIILALVYLPPFFKDFSEKYRSVFQTFQSGSARPGASGSPNIFSLLQNLTPEQEEAVKAFLK